MTSDAERVLAAGVPVAIDGEELRLVFDFESLQIIESEFGGLQDFVDAINAGWKGPRMKLCRVGLRAGLAHLEDPKQNGPAAIRRLTNKLVGPGFRQVESVANAIADGFNQALPPMGSPSKASSRASGSHGSRSSASSAGSTSAAAASSAG